MHRHDTRTSAMQTALCRRLLWASLAAVGVLACVLPPAARAQGKDDLWETTMKIEMAGMPMAMPAQTNRHCTAKGRKDEDFVPREDNCKMTESNRSGNKLSYKMACEGKNALTIAGEITRSPEKYDGKQRMTGTMDGSQVDVTQTFSGKRIGDCTAPSK